MGESWRNHLVDEGNGTMRIKAHGSMLADARIVADKEHMNLHRDDRGPEQLVNIASMPGIVGEAWAMADWHYGYGFPIGGVVATDENAGEVLVLTSIVGSDFWLLMQLKATSLTSRNLLVD